MQIFIKIMIHSFLLSYPVFCMNDYEFQKIHKTLVSKYNIDIGSVEGIGSHFRHISIKGKSGPNMRLGYSRPYKYGACTKGVDKNIVILFLEEKREDHNKEIELAQGRLITWARSSDDFIYPGVCPPTWAIYLTANADFREDTIKTIEILFKRALISENVHRFLSEELGLTK